MKSDPKANKVKKALSLLLLEGYNVSPDVLKYLNTAVDPIEVAKDLIEAIGKVKERPTIITSEILEKSLTQPKIQPKSTERVFRVIDLFAAPGGMSLGFKMAGFETLLAVDFDKTGSETYARNFPRVKLVTTDIRDLPSDFFKKYGNVDVIIGGPPCQGFSTAGRRDPEDERNNLVFQFIRIVNDLQPKWFVMENVYGLATMREGEVVKIIHRRFSDAGYKSKWKILNAANYGVPQKRRRLFFIGNNCGDKIEFPPPTHSPRGQFTLTGRSLKPYVTVKDTFEGKDLASLRNHNFPNHSPEVVEKISKVKPGEKLYPSRSMGYYRLKWDEPSWAVAIAGGGEGLIHPSEDRVISVREAAILQGFPDDFVFCGSISEAKQQVSNAVPPRLAEAIGSALMKKLKQA